MQYSFSHDIKLVSDSITSNVINFFSEVNILLPSVATGSCFTQLIGNPDRVKFAIPHMKKQVSFNIESIQDFIPTLQTYNLAASLRDCVIILNLYEDVLKIQFFTDRLETYKLLQEVSTRLRDVNPSK